MVTLRSASGATARSTWSDTTGHYDVYSPISVRGAASIADSVSGTGTGGSTSFDVKFGYTGDYSAAPHGLVARLDSSGTVLQDPDQAFDPTDGFSDAITFDLSGSAFARFEMTSSPTRQSTWDLVFVRPRRH